MSTILTMDYETTGISPLEDRPLQIGVTDGSGRVIINTLCDPCMPIDPGAEAVHGISAEAVQGFPDYAIALWAQLAVTKAYENPLIVGFNSSMFDIPMLEACMGAPVLQHYRQVDVLDVVYRYYPTIEKKKLTELHQQFLGRSLVGAHGAIQDCISTSALLQELCRKLAKSPEDFSAELEAPQAYSIIPIGKYRGVGIEDVPMSWAKWMKNNADNMRPDLQATVDWVLTR